MVQSRCCVTHRPRDPSGQALLGGYHLVFSVAALLVVAALLLAVTLLRSPRPEREPAGAAVTA